MISELGLDICALLTEKNYTPCHIFIIYVFAELILFMDFSRKSILILVLFLFIFFISLIFNEIIELNFCGLSDNIKRNIMQRGDNEDYTIQQNYLIETMDENYVIHSKELGNDNESNNQDI